MLSAVENFGPLVGPAVALSHHPHAAAHHLQAPHHPYTAERSPGYALDIVSAADATVRVSAALSPPTSIVPVTATAAAAIISTQTPLTHTQLTQLNALQTLKLQHQLQQQYEQQLSSFINAQTAQSSALGGITVLPHRPQPQVASLNEAREQQRQQQQQQQQQQHHHYQLQQQQQQQQQQLREQQSISVNLTLPANAPKYMSSPRDTSTMMPLTEFTPPPKPKHEAHTAMENGQCGAMNLVTNASNAFTSSTNYQLHNANAHTNNSSNSNPASIDNSRPSSSSSSVDVENDESMSPVNATQAARKLLDPATLLAHKQPTYSETSASSAAAAVVAAYQFNYSQLYGGGRPAGLYNAPVIFTAHNPHVSHVVQHPSAVHGAHAPPTAYLGALATHTASASPSENSVYSAEYFKALQSAVAAGVFQTVPNHTTPVFQTSPLAGNNASPSAIGVTKSRLRSPAASTASALAPTASPPSKAEQRAATSTKLSTGTYLYEKAKRSPPDTPADTEKFFKIPSGKEGSLKHRILTRPSSADKTLTTPSAMEAGKSPVMRPHNSTSSFKKGSYIELSNGSLRRVEDMRTEDFIQCAERSPHHQLIESTVVKINNNPSSHTVVIAFSYDRNQSKVDMEVATEHPFFVYGQGWASCNPELTYKAFGLKCQRLQVGDICISLTKREPPNININNNNNIISSTNNNNNKHIYSHDTTATTTTTRTTTNDSHCLERDLQPLALSDNVYAAHLKSAGLCPPPTAPYPTMRGAHGGTVHFMPPHLLANAPATHPAPYAPNETYPHFPFPTAPAQAAATTLHSSRAQHGDLTCAAQPPTNSSTRSADECAQSAAAVAAAAASAASASARKRRWSAPESFSNSEDEDDEAARSGEYQPPLRQKSAPTAAVSSNYKPYMPTNMKISASAAAAAAGQLNCDFSTNYK